MPFRCPECKAEFEAQEKFKKHAADEHLANVDDMRDIELWMLRISNGWNFCKYGNKSGTGRTNGTNPTGFGE